MIRFLKGFRRLAVDTMCISLKLYRNTVSRLTPPSCRFYPSCSEYAEASLRKHGIVIGTAKTIYRLLRCAPWSSGGPDFP